MRLCIEPRELARAWLWPHKKTAGLTPKVKQELEFLQGPAQSHLHYVEFPIQIRKVGLVIYVAGQAVAELTKQPRRLLEMDLLQELEGLLDL